MVIAEIILYFAVLILYFGWKPVKRLFGLDQRVIRLKDPRHPYDTFRESVMAKPKWLLKAHYGFLIFLFIFLFIALTVLITWLWSYLQKVLVFTDPGAIYLGSSWGITSIPVLLMSICLTNLILESCPFKSARYAGERYYHVPSLPHKLDIKLTKLLFVIFFALGFPFVILNTDAYCFIKDDGFYTHPFFSLSEIRYSIPGDIKAVEVTYDDRDPDDYEFYYTVYFTDGRHVELLNENRFESEKVVQVDNILEASHVDIARSSFPRAQWQRDIEDYNDDIVESLKQLYLIE